MMELPSLKEKRSGKEKQRLSASSVPSKYKKKQMSPEAVARALNFSGSTSSSVTPSVTRPSSTCHLPTEPCTSSSSLQVKESSRFYSVQLW